METTSVSQLPKQESNHDLERLLGNIKKATIIRYVTFGGFTLFCALQILIGLSAVPWKVVLTVFFLFIITAISDFLIRKTKLKNTVTQLSNFSLIFQIIEISIIFEALHASALIPTAGTLIITTYLFICYFSYTRAIYTWTITGITILGYLFTLVLEYLGTIPYTDVYKIGVNIAQNRGIFIINLIVGLPLVIIILFIADSFSKRLRDSLNKLTQKEKELQETGAVLEVKVDARTQELRELSESLEEQVKERTKKLQEKMEELEIFNKLAVGRELKMMELKNEIRQLRKQLNLSP
jgi:gas vesicle protein